MFSRTLQKTWENTCDGVIVKGLHQRLFITCEIYEIVQNSFFLEQLPTNVSVSRVGLAQLYKNIKYLTLLTKQICTPCK